MKKLFALLLCAAMLANLAACGSKTAPDPTQPPMPATTPATQPAAPTSAPTQAPTEPTAPPAAMGETTLVDTDSVTFTVTGVEHNDHLGMQLQVQCVNKTGRALLFSWDMVSVCGYMYDPMWSAEVAAGMAANTAVELDTYALEAMGINSVDEITFTLRVVDSENWMEKPIVEQAFTIYPTGLSAETVERPQRNTADAPVVIGDDYTRFVIEAGEEDASSYTLHVYLENNTDRNLMYTWDQVSVNGLAVDPFWAMSVAAGKKACSEISFAHSDLEHKGIQTVETVEFTLLVSDYDNWDTPNLLEETYTYHP